MVTSAGTAVAGSSALERCSRAGVRENSSTSTLPADAGRLRRLDAGEVLAFDGAACANAGAAGAATRPAAETRLAEKRRRFMFVFMVKATVEGGFAPTRQVPRLRRAGGVAPIGRQRGQRGCTLMRIAATGWPTLAQPLLEVRHELAQLGGDGGIGAQQRPAVVVDRPGAHSPASSAGTRRTAANRAFDRRSRSEAGRAGRWRAAPRRWASRRRAERAWAAPAKSSRRAWLVKFAVFRAERPAPRLAFVPAGRNSERPPRPRPALPHPGRPDRPSILLRHACCPSSSPRSSAAATTGCSSSTGTSVQKINALEPQFEQLSDAALRAKTDEFRERVADGETLDDAAARGLRRRARGRQARR